MDIRQMHELITETTFSDVSKLRNSWRDYVQNIPFSWFVTLTFKEQVNHQEARGRFFYWLRKLNEASYGKRYREKKLGVSFLLALEMQWREVLHIHALIGGTVDSQDRYLWKLFWERNFYRKGIKRINGFAQIDKFDPNKDAIGYLTKEVISGDEVDVYISHHDRCI